MEHHGAREITDFDEPLNHLTSNMRADGRRANPEHSDRSGEIRATRETEVGRWVPQTFDSKHAVTVGSRRSGSRRKRRNTAFSRAFRGPRSPPVRGRGLKHLRRRSIEECHRRPPCGGAD